MSFPARGLTVALGFLHECITGEGTCVSKRMVRGVASGELNGLNRC